MTPFKLVNLLMIVLIALATSGLGRVLHEATSHEATSHDATSHGAFAHGSTSSVHRAVEHIHGEPSDVHGAAGLHHHEHPVSPDHAPLGHRDCETCLLLAGVTAFVFYIALALLAGVVTVFGRPVVHSVFVSRLALPCLTSRGPPALA
jgi:hypothetical protein